MDFCSYLRLPNLHLSRSCASSSWSQCPRITSLMLSYQDLFGVQRTFLHGGFQLIFFFFCAIILHPFGINVQIILISFPPIFQSMFLLLHHLVNFLVPNSLPSAYPLISSQIVHFNCQNPQINLCILCP